MNKSMKAHAKAYFENIVSIIGRISLDEIDRFGGVLAKAKETDRTIFFIGNGGSAATASHFANDLAIGVKDDPKPFKALSLCDNLSKITAIGNDYGYDDIFSRQVEVFAHEGDVLVAISASGNSPNLIKAVETAQAKGLVIVGLTSFDGGRLRQMSDVCVHIPTEVGEYGPAEDGHMILDHLVSSYFIKLLIEAK